MNYKTIYNGLPDRWQALCWLALLLLPALSGARAADVVPGKTAAAYQRSAPVYQLPDVNLINKQGKKVSFLKQINDGRPVVLNFIFVSCSSICPLLSHTLASFQDKLGDNPQQVHLVSISIDPENDTPAKLDEYGQKYHAGKDWDYYTGSEKASLTLQKAFKYYRGDKMNHAMAFFLRPAPDKPWLRLDGFVSADDLMAEIKAGLP